MSQVVQRNNNVAALPSIDHLAPMAQTLLSGVLEKTSLDAAVRQIYDNMFQRSGWTYSASISNTSGQSYVDGGKTVGMCESYRNAFGYIVNIYDGLRKNHPDQGVAGAALKIELGNGLARNKFVTKKGLTLMGPTALRGNVYLEVGPHCDRLAEGLDGLNQFVFSGHWTLKVNGVEYDPIFHSVNGDNVQTVLDDSYVGAGGRFVANIDKPIPTKEFGATFIHLTDSQAVANTLAHFESLYSDKAVKVDALLSGSLRKRLATGLLVPKHTSVVKAAKRLVRDEVADLPTYSEVVEARGSPASLAQLKAFRKITQLAGMY